MQQDECHIGASKAFAIYFLDEHAGAVGDASAKQMQVRDAV